METIENVINGSEMKENLSSPLRTLTEFYEAFNNRDLEKMARNWLASEEVSMSNPLGDVKRGWNEIEAVYERIFNGAARVYVEFYDYTLHESADTFFVVGKERGEFSVDSTKIDLHIRTSRIYRLVNGEWRQIHHHGSIEDAALLSAYQQAVKNKT